MSSSGLKREVPGWVAVAVIAAIVLVIAVVGYHWFTGSSARKPGQYPPEAYQPPGYAQPMQTPAAPTDGR